MRLKQFLCFVSVLVQDVWTTEIKREIKIVLFQFYFTMCDGIYLYLSYKVHTDV